MNLLDNVKITTYYGSTRGAGFSGTTFLDCASWGGVLFILNKISTNPGATGSLIIQNSSAASTGAGCIASTYTQAVKCTTGEAYTIAVDVVKPIKRYVRLRALTCTGMGCVAIQYTGRRLGSTEARVNLATISGVHAVTT